MHKRPGQGGSNLPKGGGDPKKWGDEVGGRAHGGNKMVEKSEGHAGSSREGFEKETRHHSGRVRKMHPY